MKSLNLNLAALFAAIAGSAVSCVVVTELLTNSTNTPQEQHITQWEPCIKRMDGTRTLIERMNPANEAQLMPEMDRNFDAIYNLSRVLCFEESSASLTRQQEILLQAKIEQSLFPLIDTMTDYVKAHSATPAALRMHDFANKICAIPDLMRTASRE